MKRILILSCLLFIGIDSYTQRIRKPWSELNTSEQLAFVLALHNLSSSDVSLLANEHDRLFNDGIHDNDEFLPWHRILLLHMENLLRQENPNVTLPYWDWHEESTWIGSHLLFRDAQSNDTGLFGWTIMGTGSPWNYTRNIGSWSPNSADPDMTESSVTVFSDDLEVGNHNNGHILIGGTMRTGDSPADPIFYLHHNMVDKVWADWFRLHPNATGSGLNMVMRTWAGSPFGTVDATDYVDPRNDKVWFAHNNLLVLDLYTASGNEVYDYSSGQIHVKDFSIPNGVDVELRTDGESIKIISDFDAELGSELTISPY